MSQQAIPKISSRAVCLDCEYPLRGLDTARCPECGRGFDPANRSSYRKLDRITYTCRLYAGPLVVGGFIAAFIIFVVLASVLGMRL